MADLKVLLIGGSSHVGKSTLAKGLAAALGWDHLSTDQLARHPGRPWRSDGSRLPEDVVAYYASGDLDAMMASVLAHYEERVWPIAQALVHARIGNRYDRGLVLEGSAILPELAHETAFERCGRVWLTASHELVRGRILEESRFDRQSDADRRLIEAFVARTLAFDERIVATCRRLGEACLDAGSPDVYAALEARAKMAP